MATEIRKGADVLTLINTFETTPDDQAELMKILTEATDKIICKRPGFVSANLHAAKDGSRVVNYIQWKTRDDFQAMLKDPECRVHIDVVEARWTPDPRAYDVVETYAHVSE